MNQFTSNIDFSFTKKRFRMMAKSFSSIRSSSKSLLTVCLVSFLSFVFCTQTEINSDELYTDIFLHTAGTSFEGDSVHFPKNRVMLTRLGKPFTGVQSYYFKNTDQLFTSTTFKNGIRVKEQVFDEEGSEKYRTEIDYDFDLNQRKSLRMYEEDALNIEIIDSSPENNGLHLYREWHPNGQLKFEMTSNELGSNGLMTLYDEQGSILEQELYEDGVLIEKIK